MNLVTQLINQKGLQPSTQRMSDFPSVASGRMRSAWVGALSIGQESNWEICKDKSLWGSGANTAGAVCNGDEFFLWQSGAGWFARCIVTTDARIPTPSDPAPWDDGREYKWIFGIKVIKELDPIYQPGSTNNRQNITGIHNIRLGQFPRLSQEEANAVRSFFGLINPPSDPSDIDIEIQNDQHEDAIKQRTLEGSPERERLVMARRGQGVFRHNVEQIENSCRVTGLRDSQHLRASHIKPWKDSNDVEKVDGHNGLLLSPHVDHLFDRGWILFEDNGALVPSPKLDVLVLQSWRIEPDRVLRPFLPRQIEYLEFHRELVFQH
jgi:hypothetical protein